MPGAKLCIQKVDNVPAKKLAFNESKMYLTLFSLHDNSSNSCTSRALSAACVLQLHLYRRSGTVAVTWHAAERSACFRTAKQGLSRVGSGDWTNAVVILLCHEGTQRRRNHFFVPYQ